MVKLYSSIQFGARMFPGEFIDEGYSQTNKCINEVTKSIVLHYHSYKQTLCSA